MQLLYRGRWTRLLSTVEGDESYSSYYMHVQFNTSCRKFKVRNFYGVFVSRNLKQQVSTVWENEPQPLSCHLLPPHQRRGRGRVGSARGGSSLLHRGEEVGCWIQTWQRVMTARWPLLFIFLNTVLTCNFHPETEIPQKLLTNFLNNHSKSQTACAFNETCITHLLLPTAKNLSISPPK